GPPRLCAAGIEMPVALEAFAGECACGLDGLQRRALGAPEMNRDDPHLLLHKLSPAGVEGGSIAAHERTLVRAVRAHQVEPRASCPPFREDDRGAVGRP